VSEAEPELGLGTVVSVEHRQVELEFAGAGERRRYAKAAAPLRRIRFRVGDSVSGRGGETFRVEDVAESEGRIVYRGEGRSLREDELADALDVGAPEARLRRGDVDDARVHALRIEALHHLAAIRGGPVRGFLGGRIDLLPHQLSIAGDVAARHAPRVLLADEVGLGKTIEASLVLHRQLLGGRVGRVLILVPESLVHQWFVELVRRFHLWFKLFDEERCAAIRAADPGANPFLEEQLVLASLDFLLGDPQNARDALEAGWDVLIVDEAHRLSWSPDDASPGYRLIEALAGAIPSVLLLSGTPERLGETGHFARLRLLDPKRHVDLESFLGEQAGFAALADLVARLDAREEPTAADREILARDPTESLTAPLAALERGDESARERLVSDLLDRHGTGRVLFRNTRGAIAGFPARAPHLVPLAGGRDDADREPFDYRDDPRIGWLLDLLRASPDDKVLLICHAREQVGAILAAIEQRAQIKTAPFHEGLTLVQRDRNAAWFAEPNGARLLVCSEIGSEGRNFQFARHLVLFDLPLDPELVEQRIGRLDRIGRSRPVEIHVPYLAGTAHEVLARWHDEGLEDFARTLRGGAELLARHGAAVEAALSSKTEGRLDEARFASLLEETRRSREEIAARLEQGRDRLLERSSLRPERARRLIAEIVREDDDPSFDEFLVRLLEHFGVEAEEIGPRTYRLSAEGLFVDALPGLPAAGLSVTFARRTALEREDLTFLTRDHPLAQGAIERLLGTTRGSSAAAVWTAPGAPALLLEAYFVAEVLAPRELAADRFLAPTPVRVVVDQSGSRADLPPDARLGRAARPALPKDGQVLSRMLGAASGLAGEARDALVELALRRLHDELGAELDRLRALRAVNDRIRPEELALAAREIESLGEHLRAARVRLDSLRLVSREPAPKRA